MPHWASLPKTKEHILILGLSNAKLCLARSNDAEIDEFQADRKQIGFAVVTAKLSQQPNRTFIDNSVVKHF